MRIKSKAKKRWKNNQKYLLHGKKSWIQEDSHGVLSSTLVLDYFSQSSNTRGSGMPSMDMGNIQIKLECDIDIDKIDSNTCIFFGSDAYYSHSSSSVLLRSDELCDQLSLHPQNELFSSDSPASMCQQLEDNFTRDRLEILGKHADGEGIVSTSRVVPDMNVSASVVNPYKCLSCGRTFKYHSQYAQHMRTHSGTKPFVCNRCGKQFTQSSNLARHMLSHSQDRDGFQCNICNARFQQTAHLKAHKLLHIPNPRQICEVCGEKFPDFLALRSHLAVHINDEKRFTCDVCGKTFGYHSHWSAHKATHENSKPFHCATCRRTFVHEGNLKRHMLGHGGSTDTQRSLQLAGHENVAVQCLCPVCGKQFKGETNLKKHQRVWSHWEDLL